jgi:hypothetical protein
MEAGDSSVSLDLLIRTLLALGASSREIARTFAPSRRVTAAYGVVQPLEPVQSVCCRQSDQTMHSEAKSRAGFQSACKRLLGG